MVKQLKNAPHIGQLRLEQVACTAIICLTVPPPKNKLVLFSWANRTQDGSNPHHEVVPNPTQVAPKVPLGFDVLVSLIRLGVDVLVLLILLDMRFESCLSLLDLMALACLFLLDLVGLAWAKADQPQPQIDSPWPKVDLP